MQRILFGILTAIVVTTIFPEFSLAEGDWSIARFDVRIDIDKEGTLEVTETIVADFSAQKHGIYREIPIRYQVGAHQYSLRFQLLRVDDGTGRERKTKVSYPSNLIRIRIGNPKIKVTGRQVYRIHYTVARAILWEGEHAVLRWNTTGTQWRVPIRDVNVNLKLPQSISPSRLIGQAWSGPPGARDRDLDYERLDDQTLRFEAVDLTPGEGLTIDVAFPADTVVRPGWLKRAGWWLTDNFFYGIFLASLGSCLGFWYLRGRDRPGRRTIMVQYEPPEGLSPAEVGTLIDERVDLRDISATIIDLAVRGYLRIEEVAADIQGSNSDYRFVQRDASNELKPFERKLIDKIFADGKNDVLLSDLKEKFYPILPELRNHLYESLAQARFFDGNPKRVRINFAILSGTALLMVLVAGVVFQLSMIGRLFPVPLIISAILSVTVILVTSWFMPRKTRKGSIAWEKIAGLEEYIRRAEAENIQLREQQVAFERLLPYAIVFGLADRWASAFNDLYTQPPDWYRPADSAGFSTALLANSMNRSVNSMNQILPAQPRSAGTDGGGGWSSGGFSGGSVGGGFGGGGGGGW